MANEADIPSSDRTVEEVSQTTSYLDGIGRPVQTVVKKATPESNDLVTAYTYDAYGRAEFSYLPFASTAAQSGDVTNDGNLKHDPFQQQVAFYNNILDGQPGETNQGTDGLNWAYSKVNYESSPLNRVISSYAPGAGWVGSEGNNPAHNSKQQYLVNTAADNVQIWNILDAQGSIPTTGGPFAAGKLYKVITTDEGGHQEVEFKNFYDQLVLKKVQLSASSDDGTGSDHSGWLCTYYVYDDYGNLRFIITPDVVAQIDGSWVISQSMADKLCYRNEYDAIGRQIIKKAPGSDEVWMVYDKLNRVVLQQDGNLRAAHQWKYIQYDGLGRPTVTGLWTDPDHYDDLAYHLQHASGVIGYPDLSGQTYNVLTRNFYDNYQWVSTYGYLVSGTRNTTNDARLLSASSTSWPYPQEVDQSQETRGLLTGNWVDILTTPYGLSTVNIYDDDHMIIQTQFNNSSNGLDVSTTQYSFTGQPLVEVNQVGISPGELIVTKKEYDYGGRLTKIWKNIGGASQDQLISTMEYDELGRLHKKTFGSGIESQTYDYNARGWLLGANRNYLANSTGNYFGYDLGYDKSSSSAEGGSYNPVFNGNIAGSAWKSAGDQVDRKFDYVYDKANRLKAASFTEYTDGTWGHSYMDFSVSNLDYDANGNITSMSQNGFYPGQTSSNIDDLTYKYIDDNGKSNQLENVMDGSNNPDSKLGDFHYPSSKSSENVDYSYDANGNVIKDDNRGINSITYNYLNLPSSISILGKAIIHYDYDAAGNKLQKIFYDYTVSGKLITTTTKYIGPLVYQSKVTTPTADPSDYPITLQFASHEEGRVRYFPAVGSVPAHYAYDYFLRDHLGNVRMVLTDEQQQDIYPAATLEDASHNGGTAISVESNYYTINTGDIVAASSLSWLSSLSGSTYKNENNNGTPVNNNPYSDAGGNSTRVYRLNGHTGDKYGLGITLKVMAGDKVSIFGNSFWHNTSQTLSSYPISGVLNAFLGAFANTQAVVTGGQGMATGTVLDGSSAVTTPLISMLDGTSEPPDPTTQPKAAINWILFDDQFRPVCIGTDPVDATGASVKAHARLNIPMAKNGYLYVYCSNESDIDVYFDNLQVVDTHGPILEETHYYPFGLAMAAISDRALNKLPNYYHYQGNELQAGEFNDGSGLEEYDFKARFYDQQLGVWHSQDPANQFAGPYCAMGNNWINGADVSGKSWVGDFLKVAIAPFVPNKHRTIGGNIWAVISRFTFESPQQVAGTSAAVTSLLFGGVKQVSIFDGAVVLRTHWLYADRAFTLGNISIGSPEIQASEKNSIFQHEYGRVLQSQADGVAYLAMTALPSLADPGYDANSDRYARDGNARALAYFSKFYGGNLFVTTFWDFSPGWAGGNPINGYDINRSFDDPVNQTAIKLNERLPGFYTFFHQ